MKYEEEIGWSRDDVMTQTKTKKNEILVRKNMEGDNWAFILGKGKPGVFEICLFGIMYS